MPVANSIYESGRAASGRKRLVLGSLLAGVFGGFVAVVFSLWIEDRSPSDDSKPISVAAQWAFCKPVADHRRQFSAIWKQSEIAYIYPFLSLEEILRRFSDARIDPAERRLFAYRLA